VEACASCEVRTSSTYKKINFSPQPAVEAYKHCEILMIPYCVDNRLTDGGDFASLKRRQSSTPQRTYFLFLVLTGRYELSNPLGLVWLEGLGIYKNYIHLIGSRTHDLPACVVVYQPLRYRMPLTVFRDQINDFSAYL
jgi:hypothetical protein